MTDDPVLLNPRERAGSIPREDSIPWLVTHLPNLPYGVLDPDAYDLLLAGIASEDPGLRGWLDAALLHASARAEASAVDRRLTPYLYDALNEIGTHVHRVFMISEYRRENPDASSGELSHFLARNENTALTSMVERLQLPNLARLGQGEAASIALRPSTAQRVYWAVCHQVLGALTLCGRYDIVEKHVRRALPAVSLGSASKDSKTLLQEVSQELFGASPTYEPSSESGPDHAKVFQWRANLPNGASALGSGASKKSAQAAAAVELLRTCPTDVVNAKLQPGAEQRRTTVYVPRPDELSSAHLQTVQRLVGELDLPPEAAPFLSQALIHTSWPPEHVRGAGIARDYMPLATIGAFALPLPYWRKVAAILLSERVPTVRKLGASVLGIDDLIDLARGLGVESGLALGRGQQSSGATPSILAEAAQAVVAVDLIFRGVRAFSERPFETFMRWLEPRATSAVQGSRGSDFKTALQDVLVSLGINHSYESARDGPDHDARFRSTLTLISSTCAIRVAGRPERSKRQADQRVARATLSLIRAINRPWTDSLRTILASNQFAREVAAFVLRQALDVADASSAKRWISEQLMASRQVVRGEYDALFAWAADVADFLELTRAEPRLCLFFAALVPNTTDTTSSRFLADLRHVVEVVRALDLAGAGAVTEGDAYRTLLDLAEICRLASRSDETRDCRSIVEEWVLLSRGGTIVVDLPEDDLMLTQREGALQGLLAAASASLAGDSAAGVVVSTTMDRKHLRLQLSGDKACRRFRERWEDATLFQYLRAELSARYASDAEGHVVVEVPLTTNDSFAASVVRSAGRGLLNSIPAPTTLASLLHDLKNQLIASSVASQTIPSSRTERFRVQYELSQHLDRAEEMSVQLLDMTRVMDEVVPGLVEMLGFMRDFIAAVVRELPPGIQLVSPTASSSCAVITSGSLLRSILENLIRNAIQAMPQGGTLQVEWVPDPAAHSVAIEITDTGTGLPPDVIAAVKQGVAAQSTKQGGSGIGLWSVYRVAARLGVDVTCESSEQGTSWLLVVPSLTLGEALAANDFDASDVVEASH